MQNPHVDFPMNLYRKIHGLQNQLVFCVKLFAAGSSDGSRDSLADFPVRHASRLASAYCVARRVLHLLWSVAQQVCVYNPACVVSFWGQQRRGVARRAGRPAYSSRRRGHPYDSNPPTPTLALGALGTVPLTHAMLWCTAATTPGCQPGSPRSSATTPPCPLGG